ncbi:MAG: acyltransferase [Opitutae bacterium]|nr:acyltransferase [Opitutae bacterium]
MKNQTDNIQARGLPTPERHAALDALRSFLTLLVIAHHAVLAYFIYAPPPGKFAQPIYWAAFPITDAAKAQGIDLLVLWNDSFFMALMFLLSGLFVGPGLVRKGAGHFFRDRMVRLGGAFILGAGLLAPLAYLPAYLQRAEATGSPGFLTAWLQLGVWPAGPAWFLWVLLAFCAVAALVFAIAPRVFAAGERFAGWCFASPWRGLLVALAAVLLAYVPMAHFVNPMHWSGWGVFFFQTTRLPLYALWFAAGVMLGLRNGLVRDLMAFNGGLARRWIGWHIAAGLVFIGFVVVLVVSAIKTSRGVPAPGWALGAGALMVVSAVITSICLLATFARKWSVETPLWASLRRNAFGMYLVHYAIVTWLQYALLAVEWPGLLKAFVVTTLAILFSWIIAAGLRRLPVLKSIL